MKKIEEIYKKDVYKGSGGGIEVETQRVGRTVLCKEM